MCTSQLGYGDAGGRLNDDGVHSISQLAMVSLLVFTTENYLRTTGFSDFLGFAGWTFFKVRGARSRGSWLSLLLPSPVETGGGFCKEEASANHNHGIDEVFRIDLDNWQQGVSRHDFSLCSCILTMSPILDRSKEAEGISSSHDDSQERRIKYISGKLRFIIPLPYMLIRCGRDCLWGSNNISACLDLLIRSSSTAGNHDHTEVSRATDIHTSYLGIILGPGEDLFSKCGKVSRTPVMSYNASFASVRLRLSIQTSIRVDAFNSSRLAEFGSTLCHLVVGEDSNLPICGGNAPE